MGNGNSYDFDHIQNDEEYATSCLVKFKSSSKKFKSSSKKFKSSNNNIHHKLNKICDRKSYCQKKPLSKISKTENKAVIKTMCNRIVFIGLVGLYNTWQNIPYDILTESVFILPLKREWFYQPEKYRHVKENILNQLKKDDVELFLKVLQWKDQQNLGFWMLDDYSIYYENDKINNIENKNEISPFWKYFSFRISQLYDPISKRNYSPLILDTQWWKNYYGNNLYNSRYNATSYEVIEEICYVTKKFRSIMELLIHSNPSFLIFKYYSEEQINKLTLDRNVGKWNFVHGVTKDGEECNDLSDDYWISPEYDPYDI